MAARCHKVQEPLTARSGLLIVTFLAVLVLSGLLRAFSRHFGSQFQYLFLVQSLL